jgi:D-amino peptidase
VQQENPKASEEPISFALSWNHPGIIEASHRIFRPWNSLTMDRILAPFQKRNILLFYFPRGKQNFDVRWPIFDLNQEAATMKEMIARTALVLALGMTILCANSAAQSKKSIFVITDAEGVAGICRQDQTDPKDSEHRQLLTGEINAAVTGFLAGGADEVVVWDGHDGSQTLSAATIHPQAKLLIGALGASMTLERHYAGLAFLGQHSRANVRAGIMAHSYSSLGIQNLLMNNKPVGEIETRAALAGWYNTPVIFLSGDQAATEELRAIVPDAELVQVKEGLARYTCISLSASAAQARIREGATRAMQKIGQIKPYKIEGPVTFQIEHTTRNSLSIDAGLAPGAEVLDDRTIRFRGKDFWEAWTRSRANF